MTERKINEGDQYFFPLNKNWDFYLFERRNSSLAAGIQQEVLERYESGWVVWLFVRTDNNQLRLKLEYETPEGVVTPWSYTPLELFTDALWKWLPRYDTVNNIYVIDAQFNPYIPYNVTLKLKIENDSDTTATINKISLLRIKLRSEISV